MRRFAIFFLAACALGAPAYAQSRLALDGSLGTTGIGANLQFKINDRMAVRGGYNHLQYDVADENYEGVNYDVSLDMSTLGGFVDIHPFANGFVISAGVYGGGNKEATLVSRIEEDETVNIGSISATAEEAGILTAAVTLNDMSPYIGLGWDSALYSPSRVNFLVRAGAMFTGSPDVELSSERGTLSNDPTFQAALAEEEASLEDEIETFKVYPVLNLGLSLSF